MSHCFLQKNRWFSPFQSVLPLRKSSWQSDKNWFRHLAWKNPGYDLDTSLELFNWAHTRLNLNWSKRAFGHSVMAVVCMLPDCHDSGDVKHVSSDCHLLHIAERQNALSWDKLHVFWSHDGKYRRNHSSVVYVRYLARHSAAAWSRGCLTN